MATAGEQGQGRSRSGTRPAPLAARVIKFNVQERKTKNAPDQEVMGRSLLRNSPPPRNYPYDPILHLACSA